jgi:hypothetical protein
VLLVSTNNMLCVKEVFCIVRSSYIFNTNEGNPSFHNDMTLLLQSVRNSLFIRSW